ncbi:MAG: purine-nucleoside phosphorylase, partial [Hyphomicrobiales bacterium]|nr:purine-nucleoside phosphorylase [Hyphomicrobiales bacterium]
MSELLSRLAGCAPKTAIILGSSLGSFADAVKDPLRISYGDLKGFPIPKISGHAGELIVGKVGGKEIAVLAGRAHAYESGNPAVMRPVLDQIKAAG